MLVFTAQSSAYRKKACGAGMQLQLLKYFSQELDKKDTEKWLAVFIFNDDLSRFCA